LVSETRCSKLHQKCRISHASLRRHRYPVNHQKKIKKKKKKEKEKKERNKEKIKKKKNQEGEDENQEG
jgi:hypothetical protein